MSNADLSEAHLKFANFKSADLTNANLSGANITGAYFSNANLTNANFTRAISEEEYGDVMEVFSIYNPPIFHNTIMPDGSIRTDAPSN